MLSTSLFGLATVLILALFFSSPAHAGSVTHLRRLDRGASGIVLTRTDEYEYVREVIGVDKRLDVTLIGNYTHAFENFIETHFIDLGQSLGLKHDIQSTISDLRLFTNALKDILLPVYEDLRADDRSQLVRDLRRIYEILVEDLKAMFPSPDEAPDHQKTLAATRSALEKGMTSLVDICIYYGAPEDAVRPVFQALSPTIEKLVVTAVDLIEQHPQLLLTFASFFIPQIKPVRWFLRPFAKLFGFGSKGPMKGTFASWFQRVFLGAKIKAGSLFSFFQRLGMKGGL